MDLQFQKIENEWVAEFEATSDFNLHLERAKTGSLIVAQRGTASGEYDTAFVKGVYEGTRVIDYDFGALVYPKSIKVVSGSEVLYGAVTCPDGEVTQIGGSKYEFVDLGLPSGTKWATCNVGATSPEESGLFFQWGDTQGYKVTLGELQDEESGEYSIESMEPEMKQFAPTLSDYKFYNSETSSFTKYNGSDGLTTLELSDDAANADDSKMRIPTKEDYEELLAGTTSAWTDNYNGTNIKGRVFTSKVDVTKSIFVPAAGCVYDGFAGDVGFHGVLWSSSLYESIVDKAYNFDFDYSGSIGVGSKHRFLGTPIRPVQNK